MSSGILSQDEIDSLLNPGAPAKPARAAKVKRPSLQLYDFRRPHRVSRERLRTLEAMYEQLAKTLEGWLLSRVRGQIELRLRSVEQFTFGEFVLSLPTPCASYLVEIDGVTGVHGVVDFGQEFAAYLVDRLFGGAGGPVALDRGLTPIERMAIRAVADRAVHLLQEAWADHIPMKMQVTGFESIPEILMGSNRDDPVLVATLETVIADTTSLFLICLPFSVLDGFFSSSRDPRLTALQQKEQAELQEKNAARLKSTEVNVSARMPDFQISMRDLAALKEGSVLNTGLPRDQEVEVLLNGQRRYRAAAGRLGRRLALRVTGELEPSTSNDKTSR